MQSFVREHGSCFLRLREAKQTCLLPVLLEKLLRVAAYALVVASHGFRVALEPTPRLKLGPQAQRDFTSSGTASKGGIVASVSSPHVPRSTRRSRSSRYAVSVEEARSTSQWCSTPTRA